MFCGSVQIISRLDSPLDSQSEFQMFTLFSGCHTGGPGSIISAEHLDEYLKLGELSS